MGAIDRSRSGFCAWSTCFDHRSQHGAQLVWLSRRIQALRSDWPDAAEDVVKLLIRRDVMFDAYVQAVNEVMISISQSRAQDIPARG